MRKKSRPEHVGLSLQRYFDKKGWGPKLKEYEIWNQWEAIVGEKLAKRCRPLSLKFNILTIAVANSSWLTQLQFMKAELLVKINTTAGLQLHDIYFITRPPEENKAL